MKRKSIKNVFNFPVPHVFDLFGEVSVTESDVVLWVESVSVFDRNSPRFDWYVQNWDVINKIKSIKTNFITLEAFFIQDAANDSRY